ncbi:hypothetical protein FIBSPDRAFT_905407, partial [Athelia psychrophila]
DLGDEGINLRSSSVFRRRRDSELLISWLSMTHGYPRRWDNHLATYPAGQNQETLTCLIITGGNSGIGKQTAAVLTSKGGKVHLATHSGDKFNKFEDIRASHPNTTNYQIEFLKFELGAAKGVLAVAEDFTVLPATSFPTNSRAQKNGQYPLDETVRGRYPEIWSFVRHPGPAQSELAHNLSIPGSVMWVLNCTLFKAVQHGALTRLYASAASDIDESRNGSYLVHPAGKYTGRLRYYCTIWTEGIALNI